MAEHLAEYDFRRPGRPTTYPWDTWLDGRIWRITAADRPNATPSGFRQAALSAASRRGLTVRTRIEGETVVIQVIESPA